MFPNRVPMERDAPSPQANLSQLESPLPTKKGKTCGHRPRSPTRMIGLHTMRCSLVPQGKCPHTEHINVCEFQYLAHLLSIKIIQHISVLPCCKLKVLQPCFLLRSKSHTNRKIKISNLLAHHIISYTTANSQRICLIPVTLRRKMQKHFVDLLYTPYTLDAKCLLLSHSDIYRNGLENLENVTETIIKFKIGRYNKIITYN